MWCKDIGESNVISTKHVRLSLILFQRQTSLFIIVTTLNVFSIFFRTRKKEDNQTETFFVISYLTRLCEFQNAKPSPTDLNNGTSVVWLPEIFSAFSVHWFWRWCWALHRNSYLWAESKRSKIWTLPFFSAIWINSMGKINVTTISYGLSSILGWYEIRVLRTINSLRKLGISRGINEHMN